MDHLLCQCFITSNDLSFKQRYLWTSPDVFREYLIRKICIISFCNWNKRIPHCWGLSLAGISIIHFLQLFSRSTPLFNDELLEIQQAKNLRTFECWCAFVNSRKLLLKIFTLFCFFGLLWHFHSSETHITIFL